MNNNDIKSTLLLRQLEKYFPDMEKIPSDLAPFLASVNQSYNHFEETSSLLERAMEISSEELSETNQKLNIELNIQQQTLSKLKKSLISLGIDNEYFETEDLVQVSNYLNEEINRRKKAEKSLKESEERWQQLVHNQPEGILITKNGYVEYTNTAGLELYEAESVEELKKYNLLDFVPNEMLPVFKERMSKIQEEGFSSLIEFQLRTLKGKTRFVEANSTSITYNGEIMTQSVMRDVSAKKKTERELIELSSRLSTLLNSLNTGILMEEPDRSILHTNKRFWKLFGSEVDPQEMNGENCHNLMFEVMGLFKESQIYAEKTLKLLNNKEPISGQQFELIDGRTFERDFIPIEYDGTYLGNVWQYRDITKKKEAEKELIKALEIERNYNELNKNFVSMVSHEFRTPLTTIHSTAELLLQFGDRFKGEDLKKRVERIYNSAIKIDSLIQDVLTIGKLESEHSKTENSEFIFSSLLNDTIHVLRSDGLIGKDIEVIKKGNEVPVYYDQNLIELILRNLLENAGKYSPNSEKIVLSYAASKEGLEIICQDFGIGIPRADQETVFESFKRGSNTEHIKGTGLGLPIVKKAINKMGGSIKLESKINEGTIITVRLPNQTS